MLGDLSCALLFSDATITTLYPLLNFAPPTPLTRAKGALTFTVHSSVHKLRLLLHEHSPNLPWSHHNDIIAVTPALDGDDHNLSSSVNGSVRGILFDLMDVMLILLLQEHSPNLPWSHHNDVIAVTPALNEDDQDLSSSVNGSVRAQAPSILASSFPPSSRASLDPRRSSEGLGGAEEQRSRGAEEQRSRGAEEQRSRGAEEQRSRGAEEQRSRGAEEQRSRGAEEQRSRQDEDRRGKATMDKVQGRNKQR
ncbi:hypothetical protein DFJ58DRAFT_861989 [Suillus subalutaceus]|uniref:uncharacterized protein n=1 Tax=Suillus subalutaceus TaxID=48586 RepID=UPI001B87D4F0|nr:uncharacterized protein DFJ58DRAFT_861989 [Suillus subalutaceus]KAG1837904.1 hypothetical protein DFJ58DRAFT_861989 [Suillus subalutaceus]